jgi:hypothetical protein
MAARDTEDREGLRKICLDPVGELRRGLSVTGEWIVRNKIRDAREKLVLEAPVPAKKSVEVVLP